MQPTATLATLLALQLFSAAASAEPPGFSFSGETRARGEWLSDQFRAGEGGSDGASLLRRGRFARDAPNANSEGDPTYAYAQLTFSF